MCAALSGLVELENLVIYAKSKKDLWEKGFGIQTIPSKATFARILSAVNGKEIGDAVLDILRMRFDIEGELRCGWKVNLQYRKSGDPSARRRSSAHM